jgi:thiol-disulfide isomerase/thioredoxin
MMHTEQLRRGRGWIGAMLLLLAGAAAAATATAATPGSNAASIAGLWDASVGYGDIQVPFEFGIAPTADGVSGWFFNGDERVTSDSGHFESGHLVLEFPSYGRRIDVQLGADGSLSGSYGPPVAGSTLRSYPFSARRAPPEHGGTGVKAPSIDGLWIVPADAGKAGEKSWRFIVHQKGTAIRAAILRVDGDTGALTGHWQDGKFVLSHFDGARPLLLEVAPAADHTLAIVLRNSNGVNATLTGYRASDAKARGVPDAADPSAHTRVRDPNEPLQFSFPDLAGHVVSNTDGRFAGKVLVVDVAGSWCPNCHDEAPFLQSLYRKYHGRGLEIVTLSFEEPEQYANPVRLRAFVRDFGLEYTVLLAGTLDDLHARLPQAVNLDAYPTTFFIGRDGLVKSIHAGFAAAATGSFNTELKQDFTATIEKLLAQKAPAPRVASLR